MRNIDLCIQTWYEYLFTTYKNADIFVATQDANAFKGRIYSDPVVVNQYVFHPINYDIENKFVCLFGARVKGIYVRRNMYEEYTKNQRTDLILDKSLGWAENFLDMKYALDMAGDRYDLYIKIRPDICLCKPFFKIDSVQPNAFYVNDKRERFLWDAVFAMDKKMALSMKGFYDHYVNMSKDGLDKCFDGWNCKYNAEEVLLHYVKSKNANIINMGEVGYPITWLIGDIKNNLYWSKRHMNFNEKWKKRISDYSNKHIPCTFDFCNANPILPPLPSLPSTLHSSQYKVALLICGQLRDFEICLPSILENIIPYYKCDVFIVTQDCNSIKPRLGKGLVNQYVVTVCPTQEDKLHKLFGNSLRSIQVRNTYKDLSNDQNEQLIFKKKYGWAEHFRDVQLAIETATNSKTSYDFYIKVRPDIIFSKPLIITHSPIPNNFYTLSYTSSSISETVYVMDQNMATCMTGFYDWYTQHCAGAPTETKLYEYLKLHNARLMRLKTDAFPMNWLISDIMNREQKPRHKSLPSEWMNVVESYAKNFKPTIFDLYSPEL